MGAVLAGNVLPISCSRGKWPPPPEQERTRNRGFTLLSSQHPLSHEVCGACNCLVTDPVTHFLIQCIKFNEPRNKYLKAFITESREDASRRPLLADRGESLLPDRAEAAISDAKSSYRIHPSGSPAGLMDGSGIFLCDPGSSLRIILPPGGSAPAVYV
ncbi:unnamed protein product [Nezara viridula]|uniref:Uncharacterized protein n=1 Tax=Nezara viridula TaxID=85310 RepID=A0A9P0MMF6_NEZVI|nr:unnamed protein product [Nezara viridula]